MTQAKRSAELTHIKPAKIGINIHATPAIPLLPIHQYVHYDKGHTIYSAGQLQAFGTQVHQLPRSEGGQQHIITSEGFNIPLSYHSRLSYIDMWCPPTDAELYYLPHILFISNVERHLSYLDDDLSCKELPMINLLI
jgi:hypothetical protein